MFNLKNGLHENINMAGRIRRAAALFCIALLPLLLILADRRIARADALAVTTSTHSAGAPVAVATNPATNKIYVVNADADGSGNVSVIDGRAGQVFSTPLPVGSNPFAMAINSLTNKIYVINQGDKIRPGSVTVIDGTNDSVSGIPITVGVFPMAIAINQVTNKIYVANLGDSKVTKIDGVTNATEIIATGDGPFDIAVNSATNKIYTANFRSGTITSIDGVTNLPTTVGAGGGLTISLAVNSITSRLYVANFTSGAGVQVFDISGDTPSPLVKIPTGAQPSTVEVNEKTNTIYAGTNDTTGDSTVIIINGLTNAAARFPAGKNLSAMVVNLVTNKVYVGCAGSNIVTVIDGANGRASAIQLFDSSPSAIAVDPLDNRAYVADRNGKRVAVIQGGTTDIPQGNGVAAAINPFNSKVYTVNPSDKKVNVIDGVGNNVLASIALTRSPTAVAVDPILNKIYVVIKETDKMVIIDGLTNLPSPQEISVGVNPVAIEISRATHKIYVLSQSSGGQLGGVTIINPNLARSDFVSVGLQPVAMSIDQITDKAYVVNRGAETGNGSVSVIDGTDPLHPVTVPVGKSPNSLAIDQVTRKVYVNNGGSSDVTVINGRDNLPQPNPIKVRSFSFAVAVNSATNTIYVADGSGVSVIDGKTNTLLPPIDIPTEFGTIVSAMAFDPSTNRLYVICGTDIGFHKAIVIDGVTRALRTLMIGHFTLSAQPAVNGNINKVYVFGESGKPLTMIEEGQVNFQNQGN